MDRRVLGRTGLEVSRLGLGGGFVSRMGGNDGASARDVVRRAAELGVNYIDTAPTYADSEEVLGQALDGVSQPLYLATKLGGRPTPFDPKDKDGLRRSVETSLRLLGRDQVDILLIHEPDRPGLYDWWTDYDNFHGPVNDVLEDFKSEGLIRFTGLGGTTAYELPHIIATGRYDVVLTAYNYSLLWTEADIAVLPEARRRGVGIIAGSPLQQGALARRYDAQVQAKPRWMSPPRRSQFLKLYALADEVAMPLPELAIRFVISNPMIDMVLMGARSIDEVEVNVEAVERGPLPSDVLEQLREIASMVPFRPFEEPFNLPFTRQYVGPGGA